MSILHYQNGLDDDRGFEKVMTNLLCNWLCGESDNIFIGLFVNTFIHIFSLIKAGWLVISVNMFAVKNSSLAMTYCYLSIFVSIIIKPILTTLHKSFFLHNFPHLLKFDVWYTFIKMANIVDIFFSHFTHSASAFKRVHQ